MKKLFITGLVAIGCLALSTAPMFAAADFNPTPPAVVVSPSSSTASAPITAPASFFESVTGYFSTFSDLQTFQNKRGEIRAGMDYQSGVNISASLGISYDVWRAKTGGTSLSLESVTRNAGVAGTIVSQQAGVGWNIIVKDVKLTPYLAAGYDFVGDKLFGAIGARVAKALTEHTFAGVGIEARIQKQPQPVLTAFTGFNF